MKQLTADENRQCIDHLDSILQITSGLSLSKMIKSIKTNIPELDESKLWKMIEESVTESITTAYGVMGEKIKELMTNPMLYKEWMEKHSTIKMEDVELGKDDPV